MIAALHDDVVFRPYEPGDAAALGPSREGWAPETIEPLAANSWAFAAMAGSCIVAVGGVAKMQWRGLGWSALAANIAPRALVAVRARMIEALDEAHAGGVVTIETEVQHDFPGGHQWVRSLGFRLSGVVPGPVAGAFSIRYARTAAAAQWPPTRARALLELTARTLAHSLHD